MNNDLSENGGGSEKREPESGARAEYAPAQNSEHNAEQVAERKARGGGSALAMLAFLLALAAAAGTGWMWWQSQHGDGAGRAGMQSEVARLEGNDKRISTQVQALSEQIDSLSAASDGDPLADLNARLAGDRAQLEALREAVQEQAALARSQQQAVDAIHGRLLAAEAAMAAVSGRELDAAGELDIAEVDYLLRLASERLQLFSDPLAADRALALADAQLAALDDPSYLGVRQAISEARADLAAVDRPDSLALAARLDALQKAVPGLPFPDAAAPAANAAPEAEADWWEKLKATFASLVTVRRSTEQENRRISLQDQDYIRQRLWLQLEVAYLALMRQDQQAFVSALERVQASVDEWFDRESGAVRSFEESLKGLQGQNIAVAWPDISAPWTALRRVRAVQAAPGPAPAGVSPPPAATPPEPEMPPETESAEASPDEAQ